ncbi:MAG: hypothetical protein AB3N10_21865, partial [Allomuricauda sp.]
LHHSVAKDTTINFVNIDPERSSVNAEGASVHWEAIFMDGRIMFVHELMKGHRHLGSNLRTVRYKVF